MTDSKYAYPNPKLKIRNKIKTTLGDSSYVCLIREELPEPESLGLSLPKNTTH